MISCRTYILHKPISVKRKKVVCVCVCVHACMCVERCLSVKLKEKFRAPNS